MLDIPELISIENSKCDQCFTCVKNCPVKAIFISPEEHIPSVKNARCIGCGICVDSCRQGAITYRSSIEAAKQILTTDNKKIAIISPSISSEFNDITDYRKFISMIRSLGIQKVYDEAFGIDLVASQYKEFFENFRGRYYLTSCDPVVVSYVEKFHPSLVNNLTPFVSPMIATTRVVRSIEEKESKIFFLSPDIASKDEALRYDGNSTVDCVLTFSELRKLFEEFKIDETTVDFSKFDGPEGYKGTLYPIGNGMLQAAEIDEDLLTSRLISIEGIDNMIQAVEEFEKSVKIIHRNLHIMSGNHISSPGMDIRGNQLYKEYLTIKYAQKRIKEFDIETWKQNKEKFKDLDLTASFSPNDQRLPEPPKEEIRAALQSLRKIKGHEANCCRCGYQSCHEFAKDMASGIVTANMCATYTLRYSQQYNKTVIELNEQITKLENELKETKLRAIDVQDDALQKSELSDAMMEKLRAGVVIVDSNLKIVKANKTFAYILGDDALDIYDVIPGLEGADLNKLLTSEICQLFSYVLENAESIDSRDVQFGDKLLNLSVFSFRENEIAGAIVRDMQAPEVQRSEVIKRITEVINTNLEMVQKIGFLLGENAADVERMLNSIIDFYQSDSPSKTA